jgi:hypothetical protein
LGGEVTESEFVNRRIVLARRPAGAITRDDFTIETFKLQDVPTGHLVLRVILIQIAPAARAVMTNTTPFPQTAVGDGILCAVVGEVVAAAIVGQFARQSFEHATRFLDDPLEQGQQHGVLRRKIEVERRPRNPGTLCQLVDRNIGQRPLLEQS